MSTKAGKTCSFCTKSGAVNRCAACKVAFYCNKSCQRRHWKAEHKIACVYTYKEKNLRHPNEKKIKDVSDRYNHALPLSIYNHRKFMKYVMENNSEVHRPLMAIIFQYLTGFFMEFEFVEHDDNDDGVNNNNNNNIDTVAVDTRTADKDTATATTTLFVDVFRNYELISTMLDMINYSHALTHATTLSTLVPYTYNQWIECRVLDLIQRCVLFDISVVRYEQNDENDEEALYQDTLDILVMFRGDDIQCMPIGIASVLCSECIPKFKGKDYAALLKSCLDYYQFPFSKMRQFGLSWSLTANVHIRSTYVTRFRELIGPEYSVMPSTDFYQRTEDFTSAADTYGFMNAFPFNL